MRGRLSALGRGLRRVAWSLGLVLLVLGAGCASHRVPGPLPAASEVEPDTVMIFLHGYLSRSGAMARFVSQFTREGIPPQWLSADRRGPRVRFHGHSFDFSRFTRAGAEHNTPVEALAEAFGAFYQNLPRSCPICRRWENRPVKVVVVAHSFGGVLTRQFLLNEAQRAGQLREQVPGGSAAPRPWRVERVVTMGTPFFGSVRTRFTQGFLSLVINGFVRTLVMGFVRPELGGTFGNVIDAQAQALRIGSPYLWESAIQWARHVERAQQRGENLPSWLVVAAVGTPNPQYAGDGMTRFASANLEPLAPKGTMETYVSNVPHGSLIRLTRGGPLYAEQMRMLRVVSRFVWAGTLAGDETGAVSPWAVVQLAGRDYLVPGEEVAKAGSSGEGAVRQWLYLEPFGKAEERSIASLASKRQALEKVLAADQADVWLRFYEGRPGGVGQETPRVLALDAPLSYFQNGLERSRDWTDLVSKAEKNTSLEEIPVVQSMAPGRSHLISIPDVTPSGPYRLFVRLKGGLELGPGEVKVEVEGGSAQTAYQSATRKGVPVWIRPHQANLVHIYLDGQAIRMAHPEVARLAIREVALEPEYRR